MEKFPQKLEKSKELFETNPKKWMEDYLADVGLKLEDLEGKKILEVGAGSAKLAKRAKEFGIDVVSLEKNPQFYKKEEIHNDLNYVEGDVLAMPFSDDSFDIIISRAAPPTVFFDNKEDVIKELKEIKRVLKEGGKFYFGPGANDKIIAEEDIYGKKLTGMTIEERNVERSAIPREERIKRINEKYLEFLRNVESNIEEYPIERRKDDLEHSYIMSKIEEKE